jgi:hypothetical protein
MEYLAGSPGSFRLDVCGPDHSAPLLRFLSDQLAVVGRRECKYRSTQVGKLRSELRIGERRVDCLVELADDL